MSVCVWCDASCVCDMCVRVCDECVMRHVCVICVCVCVMNV